MGYAEINRSVVAQSHLRCADQHRLVREERHRPKRLLSTEVSDRRGSIQGILARNSQGVRSIRSIAQEAGFCVMISDADGVVVEEFSDSNAAKSLSQKGLKCGTVWGEEHSGTNAISMAILSGKTHTISGDDHFLNSFKPFTCTAAPFLDHKNEVLGTVDLSGIDTQNRELLAFVRFAISHLTAGMQAEVFLQHYTSSLIIELNDGFSSKANALVAIASGGDIEGITKTASDILDKQSQQSQIGRPLADYMNANVDQLLSSVGRTMHVEVANARTCFVKPLMVPKIKLSSRPPATSQFRSIRVPGKAHNNSHTLSFDQLAGSDKAMIKNISLCRRLLNNGIPILLQGETGVGKDAFANAMHMESNRAKSPFIVVNCSASSESLLDSELFGYSPGTFTGGLSQGKTGKIIAANHGTLMLDEIGDMPMELQGRLLRVLSENEVTPLGAVKPVQVDINFICATHKDMDDLVANNQFREDLYYRLNGAKITIPNLHERTDFKEVVQTLINNEADGDIDITEETMQIILRHNWPGNIRQLINTVRYGIACCKGKILRPEDLPPEIIQASGKLSPSVAAQMLPPTRMASTRTLNETRQDLEQMKLLEALENEDWNVTKAARRLGVSRATMHRKMAAHEIARPL